MQNRFGDDRVETRNLGLARDRDARLTDKSEFRRSTPSANCLDYKQPAVYTAVESEAVMNGENLRAELDAARGEIERLRERSTERMLVTAQALHDIRGTLTLLNFCAEALDLVPENREKARSLVAQITRSTRALGELTGELLLFFQSESGNLPYRRIEVKLEDEIRSVIGAYRLQAESKGLALHVRVPGELPQIVVIDPLGLRRVVGNLLSNAIRFTDHGYIELTILYLSGTLEISVTDTGRGIPEEYHAGIFRPYPQGREPLRREWEGIGLGLFTGRQLAALMGGELTLVRSAPGEGSLFRLTVKAEVPGTGRWRAKRGNG